MTATTAPGAGDEGAATASAVSDSAAPSTRLRVISDNDYAGDPDGLFQLVHLLLCRSVDVRAVIPSAFRPFPGDPWNDRAADEAARLAQEAMDVTGRQVPIARASNTGLVDRRTPIDNAASRAIIDEALRDDSRPLLVLVGGGLTAVASALLLEPRIADRLTVVWIGGCVPADEPDPAKDHVEYNTSIDIAAAQVVFEDSSVPVWQVPHDTYRQAMVSWDELTTTVYCHGRIGPWLREKMRRIEDVFDAIGVHPGEAFVLGDNPLVLLGALHTPFEPDTASSRYVIGPAPAISDAGRFTAATTGRPIRVYRSIDMRLLMADFTAKLALAARASA